MIGATDLKRRVIQVEETMFTRLLKGASGGSEISAQEEYLTQVLHSVLEANPSFAEEIMQEFCGIQVGPQETIKIKSEEHVDLPTEEDTGTIDIVIETDNSLVFIENKIFASLNEYTTEQHGEMVNEDQIERYHRFLEKKSEDKNASLLLICQKPTETNSDLNLFDDYYFWWDLYKVAERIPDDESESGLLLDDFLDSLKLWQLDPPKALSSNEEFSDKDLRRVLAEIGREIDSISDVDVQVANRDIVDDKSWLKFQKNGDEYKITVTRDGKLRGKQFNEGRLERIKFDNEFWDKNFEGQKETIKKKVDNVETQTILEAGLDELLEEFGSQNAEWLIKQTKDIAKKVDPKTWEITCDFHNGNRIRFGPYSDYDRLIIKHPEESQKILSEHSDLISVFREYEDNDSQYNLNIDDLTREEANSLFEFVQAFAEAELN